MEDLLFNKDDDQKINTRKSKRKDGMVYAHNKGVSSFHDLGSIVIGKNGETLLEALKTSENGLKKIEGSITIQKEVLLNILERVERLEKENEKWNG